MRTAKEKECPKCHATVKRLSQSHISGECLQAIQQPAGSTAKRKVNLKPCPGCNMDFGRLRKSGVCKKCESSLSDAQKAAVEAARPKPKPETPKEVTVGGRYRLTTYADVVSVSLVDDEPVVEFRLNGGPLLYKTQHDFLLKYAA